MNFPDEPVNSLTIIISDHYYKFNEGLFTKRRLLSTTHISYKMSATDYHIKLLFQLQDEHFGVKHQYLGRSEAGIILTHPMSPNHYLNAKITFRILSDKYLFLIHPNSKESTYIKQDKLSALRFYLGKNFPYKIIMHKKFMQTRKNPDMSEAIVYLVMRRYNRIKILFTILTYNTIFIDYERKALQSFYIEYKSKREYVYLIKSMSVHDFTEFLVEGAKMYIILSKMDANYPIWLTITIPLFTRTISFDRVDKKVPVVLRANSYFIVYFQDASDNHTEIRRLLFYRFENKNDDAVHIKVGSDYVNTKYFNIILPLDKAQVYNLHRDIYELHMSDLQRLVDKLIMDGAVVASMGELGLYVILQ